MDVVNMVMAMCEPKLIDLDSYISAGASLSDALVMLFSQGGGQIEAATDDGLFNDLLTNRPIKVGFTINGVYVMTSNVNVVKYGNSIQQLAFEVIVAMLGNTYRVTVIMQKASEDGSMFIYLKIGTV